MPVDGSACTAVVPFSNTNPWVDSFRLKTRNFVIGGTPFVINQAWDDRTEEDPEPTGMKWTGAAVWDAAVVLSDFLCTRKSLIEDKRVLEVGSGLALVSVVAASLLPAHIIATDYDEHVLGLARGNLERNVPELAKAGRAEARQLSWGSEEDAAALAPPFDVVIGSDVVYREEMFKPLLKTLQLTMGEHTLLVLAHRPRGLGEDKFFFWLKKELDVVEFIGPELLPKEFIHSDVRIHICKKKPPRA
eukprot:CAMPEP_0177700692 /NCGR_PEP_ID=MMETSP0484_2-20121128/6227_1 /TAXON_ID=354590 /ORGANISM="Rhodomonas lens, Strain RHODO" /LENGTH=245 /DNA_ID=CAMNT_0019211903 /DNA_START=150 /DNA_END=887 /DNA_ORIENTATION=+